MSNIPPPPPIGGGAEQGSSPPPEPQPYVPPQPPPIRVETSPEPPSVPPAAPPRPPVHGYASAGEVRAESAEPVRKRSKLGIVALILGIFGIIGITAVIGLVLGMLALRESRLHHGAGKALAVSALVLNGFWIVLLSVGFILSALEGSPS
jgi:hypothetical protein